MKRGFTLSELLIALLILGVIATFTIPKVLNSQQDNRFRAVGKETAGALSEALQNVRLNEGISTTTDTNDLTRFLNYVKMDTVSNIDNVQTVGANRACSAAMCLQLHNGGILNYAPGMPFDGTTKTDAVFFYLDPDGRVTDGTANGAGKSVVFFIYADGHVRTYGTMDNPTRYGGSTDTPNPSFDPPWFGWD